MKLVLYGLNYFPESTGIGLYSGQMISWLINREHTAIVITTPPYYPHWKVDQEFRALRYRRRVSDSLELWRVPIYVPSNPSKINRIMHLASYAIASFPIALLRSRARPDVVLFVQPTLFAAIGAIFMAKLSGAKSVMHIQDFEVDAMLGLGMGSEGVVSRLAFKVECWLMCRFDIVSTISVTMLERAEQKGVPRERLRLFPNWADINFVTPEVSGADLKRSWGFSYTDRVILYSGNIGVKQGLEIILEAAAAFEISYGAVQFVIVGAGATKEQLMQNADARKLTNVHFMDLVPWKDVPNMLALADIHLVVQRCGVADAVLPSKLTNILSAGGHALVTAERDTEMGKMAEAYPGIFDCIEPEQPEVFVDALKSILARDLSQPNMVARNYAVEHLDKEKLLPRMEKELLALCE